LGDFLKQENIVSLASVETRWTVASPTHHNMATD